MSNETDVNFQLLIDGNIVGNLTIPELLSRSSHTVNYSWTPAEGTYNITAYTPQVPNEVFTANNVVTKFVSVISEPAPSTHISVVPTTKTVMINNTVTVSILISNVVDVFIWQIKLCFNDTILSFVDVSYPFGHVFHDQAFFPVSPVAWGNYMVYGCTLLGVVPGFNGNGMLC